MSISTAEQGIGGAAFQYDRQVAVSFEESDYWEFEDGTKIELAANGGYRMTIPSSEYGGKDIVQVLGGDGFVACICLNRDGATEYVRVEVPARIA